MNQESDFYTIIEFANKLRVHPHTIRRAIHQGRIQAIKIGIGKRGRMQ